MLLRSASFWAGPVPRLSSSRNDWHVLQHVLLSTKCTFVLGVCTLFSGTRGSFLALLAAGHAGGPSVHYGTRLDPGRAPWHVLWTFEVDKVGK